MTHGWGLNKAFLTIVTEVLHHLVATEAGRQQLSKESCGELRSAPLDLSCECENHPGEFDANVQSNRVSVRVKCVS